MVVRKVVEENDLSTNLVEALERAYPFGGHIEGRQVWLDAIQREVASERLNKLYPPRSTGAPKAAKADNGT